MIARIHSLLEDTLAPFVMPTLARFSFAAIFLMYFWNSAQTKLGAGLFSPDPGAYIQILPRVFEAAGYDPTQIGPIGTLVVIVGTIAEFVLPALIVLGLATRLAAMGMIVFVAVQSWVDVMGHGREIGAWFDNLADAVIADQRLLWIMLLLILVFRGAGPLSVDYLLRNVIGAGRTAVA